MLLRNVAFASQRAVLHVGNVTLFFIHAQRSSTRMRAQIQTLASHLSHTLGLLHCALKCLGIPGLKLFFFCEFGYVPKSKGHKRYATDDSLTKYQLRFFW